jgi:transposase InsO family protein
LRADHGAPFASTGAGGLSRRAVLVLKAGVRPERIAPGRPQQNGRHERLHLTLLQDTARPPARSRRQQLDRFHVFQLLYHTERPHQALGDTPPAGHDRPSSRRRDGVLREPDYAAEYHVRRVRHNGEIK